MSRAHLFVALPSEEGIIHPHGNMHAGHFTCRFCARYVPRSDRHHDQMVQAARSGYQNIAEGSEDSATSKKLEMNLTNVARSSLDEARKDYIEHLTHRGLRHWQEGEAVFTEARNLRPKTLEEAAAWVNRPGAAERIEERAANLGAILAAQAHWLTERLMDRQARDFETGGGFSERLYRARTGRLSPSVQSVSGQSRTCQPEPPLTRGTEGK